MDFFKIQLIVGDWLMRKRSHMLPKELKTIRGVLSYFNLAIYYLSVHHIT